MTYTELAEAINNDFKTEACHAWTEGAKVVVRYRAKKDALIFIKEGVVTNQGSTTSIANKIADKYNLQKNID